MLRLSRAFVSPARMSKPTHPSGSEWRNFYGRISGKTLNKAQVVRLENDLEALAPGPVGEGAPMLDFDARFDGKPVWLEIGFGGGEHLVHMAQTYPDVAIIGAEPFVNGVAMLLGKVEAAGVTNLAVHPGDVRPLMDVLPTGSVQKAFLNYPDPWPKARHHRRRFVTPGYLELLARVMAPGAEFRVATDIEDYVRQTMQEAPKAGFELVSGPDFEPWDDWVSTRYEQKALREGRVPHYVTWRAPT